MELLEKNKLLNLIPGIKELNEKYLRELRL
jgi:hypothetical protein